MKNQCENNGRIYSKHWR